MDMYRLLETSFDEFVFKMWALSEGKIDSTLYT